MQIADILARERVACDSAAASRSAVLAELASLAASGAPGTSASDIYDGFAARERLGSTGIGRGVAIPHGRLGKQPTTVGAFIRTRRPVEFDALDNRPVDLYFALLVPAASTEEHLKILSSIAAMFSDTAMTARLRAAPDADALYRELTEWQERPV